MDELPRVLKRDIEVLQYGYPEGVPEEERTALLRVLWSQYSERNFGLVLSRFLSLESAVQATALGVRASSETAFDARLDQRVRERLAAAGWEFETE